MFDKHLRFMCIIERLIGKYRKNYGQYREIYVQYREMYGQYIDVWAV